MKKRFGDGQRRPRVRFNPSPEYIKKAVEEYLRSGGKISKADRAPVIPESDFDQGVDGFLMGEA